MDLARRLDADGSLFRDLGLEKKVHRVIKSIHTCSWFQVPNHDEFLRTRKGSRQGCPLGGVLFNLSYAVALFEIDARF